ncbi:hypothetical protein ACP70R_015842 [Stipagrostis hirtigluma subsp. patula]
MMVENLNVELLVTLLHKKRCADLEPSDEPNAKICEVPCLRFFHATREADNYSGCSTVGGSNTNLGYATFFLHQLHKKGNTGMLVVRCWDFQMQPMLSVFRGSHVNCVRFYPEDPVDAARCRDQVAAGVVFECQRPHRAGYDFE